MNRPPQRYYIASALENAEQVRQVKARLDAAGWTHTYDWTVHGSVQKEGADRIREVASSESVGVFGADVIIVLLPGGRGTHAELGMFIGKLDTMLWLATHDVIDIELADLGRLVCVYSPRPEIDFGSGKTCAFYHHPYVQQFGDLDEMVGWLLSE